MQTSGVEIHVAITISFSYIYLYIVTSKAENPVVS